MFTRKPIAASRCAAAIAVPMTEEGYFSDVGGADGHRLAPSYLPFQKYRREFIEPVTKAVSLLKEAGVSVFLDAVLDDLHRLFSGDFEAVILITHSWNGNIEFRDGFASPADIVSRIPNESCFFIDLSLCWSEGLVKALEVSRPGIVCHRIPGEVTPALWMQYYRFLFWHIMHDSSVTYLEASLKAYDNLLELLGSKNSRHL